MIASSFQLVILICCFTREWQFRVPVLCSLILVFQPAVVNSQYYEYELKSGFVYQFSQFTTWPELDIQYFQIGILGENPFGEYLQQITDNRLIHDKLVLIKQSFTVSKLRDCQVIFVSKSEEDRIKEVLSEIDNLANNTKILTIGDAILDFCGQGGMINFTEVDGNAYFFNLNLDIINKHKLVVNSKILKLAHKVISSQKPP